MIDVHKKIYISLLISSAANIIGQTLNIQIKFLQYSSLTNHLGTFFPKKHQLLLNSFPADLSCKSQVFNLFWSSISCFIILKMIIGSWTDLLLDKKPLVADVIMQAKRSFSLFCYKYYFNFFILLTFIFFIKNCLITCITGLINVKLEGREASLRTHSYSFIIVIYRVFIKYCVFFRRF